jgi:hypothetical protein
MFCTVCGASNNLGAEFCTKCGSPMKRPAEAGAAPVGAAGTAPATPVGVAPMGAPLAPPAKRSNGTAIALISVAVVFVIAAGAFAAWQFLGIGRTESATSTASTAGGDSRSTETSGGPGGETSSTVGTGGGKQLTGQASYAALADHYTRLKALADGIDYRPSPDAYGRGEGCTGFVFEVGGFNASIAVKNSTVRAALPGKCQGWLDKIASDRADLEATVVDPSYSGQKSELLKLYGYLTARVTSMFDAATIAVSDPQSELMKQKKTKDTRWYKALHPANKTNYQLFEKGYPSAQPEQL